MRKIITIGESVLDTLYNGRQPVKAFVGGRIACAAATLGTLQHTVSMVSECATDRVGDLIVDFLERHQVDTHSIDRYTDGTTPMAAIFANEGEQRDTIVNYGRYPKDRFDVIWPRIDENDIVLFGSLYAIDTPQRERLFELISYASQRKAILLYLPGFQHGINFRITRVMPAILENLEIADLVIAHDRDLHDIFPGESAEDAFHNHIEYYGDTYLHIAANLDVTMMRRGEQLATTGKATGNLLGWQAGFTAGIIDQLIKRDIAHDDIAHIATDMWRDIIAAARDIASQCAASDENTLDKPV